MPLRRSPRIKVTQEESLLTAPSAAKRRRKDTSVAAEEDVKEQAVAVSATAVKGDDTPPAVESRSTPNKHGVSSVVMVPVPDDFSIGRAACSYGYYLVPPNVWRPDNSSRNADSGTFSRPLRFGENLKYTAQCEISQALDQEKGKAALTVKLAAERLLTESDMKNIRAQVVRMFQTTLDLTEWYRLNSGAKKRQYGRLFRSPTLFEDMVKCVTACNMKFGGTMRMNKLMCEVFGRNQAFPTPEDLIGVEADDFQERAKVGYRSDRILRLAQAFREGAIDIEWLESPGRTREEVLGYVKKLYGFGEFAASNVTMLLGFYDLVPMDSETVRHFKDFHGIATKNVKEVAPKVRQQYDPYSPYQFLQYWFEMIQWHEKKRGSDVHMWAPEDFTAYPS